MKENSLSFDLFRYQILPITRKSFQPDFVKEYDSLEDLLAHKNEEVYDALLATKNFAVGRTLIRRKILFTKESDSILYKLAPKKPVIIENEEFKQERVSNWPGIFVFIWNHPDKQYIAVQARKKAFQDTSTVANTIMKTINRSLKRHNLRVNVEAVFEKNEFWKLVKEHQGKLQRIKFELITPNLSSISSKLPEELREFAKDTNTVKTNLEIKADPDSSILLDEKDPTTAGLVEYSSEGQGNIQLKARGIRQSFVAGDNKKSFTIDELEISGLDPEDLVAALQRFIK